MEGEVLRRNLIYLRLIGFQIDSVVVFAVIVIVATIIIIVAAIIIIGAVVIAIVPAAVVVIIVIGVVFSVVEVAVATLPSRIIQARVETRSHCRKLRSMTLLGFFTNKNKEVSRVK